MNKFKRIIVVDQLFRCPSGALTKVKNYLNEYFSNSSVRVSHRRWELAALDETVVIELEFYNEQEYLLFVLKQSNRVHTAMNGTVFLKNTRPYTDFKL